MNLKKLFSTGLLLAMLFITGVMNAQVGTYYVNNITGDNGVSGYNDPLNPTKSVAVALASAPSGSTISVAFTGANYVEGNVTISGRTYTFTSTGAGIPRFTTSALNVGSAAPVVLGAGTISGTSPAVVTVGAGHGFVSGDVIYMYGTGIAGIDNQYWTVTVLTATTFSIAYDNIADPAEAGTTAYRTRGTVTFTGANQFQFDGGLNLFSGTLTNGSLVKVGTQVYRTELGSVAGSQLDYTGVIPFVYDDVIAGAPLSTITTGLEFPAVTNMAGALTVQSTSGSVLTVQLNADRTVGNGDAAVLTNVGAANKLNLGGFTLTVVGTNVGHNFGGDVTNGTLTVNMTAGNASFAGAVALPNVIATSTDGIAGTPRLLTLAGNFATSLTANNHSSITAAAIANINAALNTTNVVTNTSTGVITLSNAGITVNGNVYLSATGLNVSTTAHILFTGAGAVVINGNVTNSAGIALGAAAKANMGLITFPDQPTTITGVVKVDGAFSGATTTTGGATNYTTNGEIRFGATTVPVTLGSVLMDAKTGTGSGTTGGTTVQTNYRILFASTTGNVIVTGGFTNSSAIVALGFTTGTNGTIQFTGRTTGTVGTVGSRTGAVLNTSTSAVATNGLIDFAGVESGATVAAGTFFGTSITQGAFGAGGSINIGGSALNLSGSIINNRTAAGGNITVGVGSALATIPPSHVISGSIENNSPANITIDLNGNDVITVTGALKSTVALGVLSFDNAAAGLIIVGSVDASAGTINVPATHSVDFRIGTTFTVSGTGIVNLLGTANVVVGGNGAVPAGQTGNINWTAGTIAFGNRVNVLVSGLTNQIGAALTSPVITSAATTVLDFVTPFPNVNQSITVGTFDPVWPGVLQVSNNSSLTPPYVLFSSLGGTTSNANLYVTGGGTSLIFNTSVLAGVDPVNTIQLNNVRINVGKNGVASGNFQNSSGYTSINGGRVVMSGNATGQFVNAGGNLVGATFGGFGVDNQGAIDGTGDVRFGSAAPVAPNTIGVCTFTNDFYLGKGEVDPNQITAGAVIFDGLAPYPTIYRTLGLFINVAPTFNSYVNVYYSGTDKTTSLEVPAAGNRLWSLTVATNTGAVSGQGVVTLGGNTTVNGILTINADQSLYTAGNTLVLAGSSVVLTGRLVDDGNAVPRVQLGNLTGGTAITGAGSLPSLTVNTGSTGNTVAGIPGLVSGAFGADNVLGTVDDAFTTYDGNILFAANVLPATSSLGVSFTGNGPHVAAITTDAYGTLTLNNHLVASGAIAVGTGTIALGDFNFTVQNAAFGFTGGAVAPFGQVTSGTGTLIFTNAGPTVTVGTAAGTIAANVAFRGAAATMATNNLTLNGMVYLGVSTPTANNFTIPAGMTLTIGGPSVTLYGASVFTAGGGTGILNLVNNVGALLTVNTTAAGHAVGNLSVGGNVTLSGPTSLTVNGTGTGFVMNSGTLTIGNANLVIGGGAVATPFVYNGGTIAGAGYVDWSSIGTWTMNAPLALTNLQVDRDLDITNGNTNLIANGLTVNNNLYLNGTAAAPLTAVLTHARTVAPLGTMLTLAAAPFQMRIAGTGSIAASLPNYLGTVNYLFSGNSSAPNAFTWPTAQANNVTITLGAAANTVTTGRDISIAGNLTETVGRLNVSASTTFTVATTGATITVDHNTLNSAIVLLGAGPTLATFTGPDVNLVYTDLLGAATTYNTGPEYAGPAIVRNISIGAGPAASTTDVTLATARNIAGTLSMFSTLHVGANTTWSLAQTIPAGSTVFVDATFTSTWNAGLNVTGTYTNNGTTVIPAGFTLAGIGAVTNNATFTLDGLNLTGASVLTLAAASTTTLTGNGAIAGLTLPAIGGGFATITSAGDLAFAAGAWTNTNLNLILNGVAAQAVTLAQNRVINNLTLNKPAVVLPAVATTVTISGGNLTLNPPSVAPAPVQAAGVLTLTHGVLKMTDPALLTVQITVVGGIITNLGYLRNPALSTDLAHVIGRLGVAIPAGTIGRSEWPVGSATRYRPAAITFTAGNATIAPTTIIVSHVEEQPITPAEIAAGFRPEFPLDGGTKVLGGPNWIGSATPYYWLFEATTSLGAAQSMNVELNGTDMPTLFPTLGNRNHNDLRIIKRFDGNVAQNRYNVEGSNLTYTNALYENTPVTGQFTAVVRNLGSLGSAISQRAIFTIGLPTQAPLFNDGLTTATLPVSLMNEAAAAAGPLNIHTSTHTATDTDVSGVSPVYGWSLKAGSPALPTDASTVAPQISATGIFTWTPGWAAGSVAPGTSYVFVITATKAGDPTAVASRELTVRVTNTDRPATWTTENATLTGPTNSATTATYLATDADGDPITYTVSGSSRAVTTMPTVVGGAFSYTPTFADLQGGTTVTFTITATSNAVPIVTTTVFTITSGRKLGDVRADAATAGAGGAVIDNKITTLDATWILRQNVGLDVSPAPATEDFWAADVNASGTISPVDASWVLFFTGSTGYNPATGSGGLYPGETVSMWKTNAMGEVSFANATLTEGTVYNLPIVISNTQNVVAASVKLNLDNSLASVKYVNSTLPAGTTLLYNYENGTLKIALAGVSALQNGTTINVGLELANKEAKLDVIGSAQLNDNAEIMLAKTSVKEIPTSFGLDNNYPNPFNPSTVVKYQIATNEKVSLIVYDMLGRVVRTVVNELQEAGYYTATWNGTNDLGAKVSSGVYIYRLQAGSFVATKKMNLIK